MVRVLFCAERSKKKPDLAVNIPIPLGLEEFQAILHGPDFQGLNLVGRLAVAVSGGSDSMVLVRLLSLYAEKIKNIELYALIVDHGLRPEAGQEARQTCDALKAWPCVSPHVLELDMGGVSSSIQEKARTARYEAFESFCRTNSIKYLFLGHHQDDQAETFLFRLAKGSGLDGLTCMKPVQQYSEHMFLLRPFLDIPKDRILTTCEEQKIEWVEDCSNRNKNFSRVRLREARSVLQSEGLSAKRLSVTAKRLARTQKALNIMVKNAEKQLLKKKETNRIVWNLTGLRLQPEEIQIRLILQSIDRLSLVGGYGPRLSSVESLSHDLQHQEKFRTRTLHGLKFIRDDQNEEFVIESE